MFGTILVAFLSFACATHAYDFFPAFSEDCERWAHQDGECINNHPFMWSKCLLSCMRFGVDDDVDKCEAWADEGECTNNPNYIHVHCPRSCKLAIAWSPWVRNALGLDEAETFEPPNLIGQQGEPCGGVPVDAFSAGKIVHMRLSRFLAGEYKAVTGFSTAAPTEYLGMLGLAEAVLYCLRMYEVVIRAGLARAESASEEADLTHQAALNKERIDFVMGTLGSGYSSDLIMRKLPDWLLLVEDSALAANFVVAHIHHQSSPDSYRYCEAGVNSPQLGDLVPYYLGETAAAEVGEGEQAPPHFTLHNGALMPSVGLGTWQLQGKDCYDAVLDAIKAGYRSIDTAQAYQNEHNVGDAIKEVIAQKLVTRQQLFLATKLSDPADAGYEKAKALVQRQLAALQTSYLDLYMLHSPLEDAALQADTWRALEDLYTAGVLRAIGVSNFGASDLAALNATARVKPMVVQNKVDPYHVAKQLDNVGDAIVEYARDNKMVIVAYSSFSAYPFVMKPSEDPVVRDIARRRRLTPAQVLLKWSLQRGFAVIPRSTSPERLVENLAVLTLPPLHKEDLHLLDTLELLVSSPVSKPGPK